MKKVAIILSIVCFVFLLTTIVKAEPGVSDKEIVVGQVAALDGPAKGLGIGMKAGLDAAFGAINDQGGVNGKKIRLISYDDGYEPEKCIEQTRKIVGENIFALIGYVGTPTAKSAVPIAEEQKIPFIGPFTGAEFLRNPVKHYVLNVRASYYDETEAMVERLTKDLGVKKIACFYQNDSFGQAGLSGAKIALEKRSMSLVAEGSFERNTLAVKGALATIKAAEPEAIIMVGPYAPCAEFIKLAKQVGMTEVKYLNVSFVGSDNLKEALGDAGEGVIITQVVPFPWDKSNNLVAEYQEDMKKYSPQQKPGFVSLEGYITGKFFAEAVKAAGATLTREGLISAVESKGTFDLKGETLTFSASDHQGIDGVHLTVISGGEFKEVTSLK